MSSNKISKYIILLKYDYKVIHLEGVNHEIGHIATLIWMYVCAHTKHAFCKKNSEYIYVNYAPKFVFLLKLDMSTY